MSTAINQYIAKLPNLDFIPSILTLKMIIYKLGKTSSQNEKDEKEPQMSNIRGKR